jgi:hypothetical protein
MSHEKNRAVVHPYPNARERERSANGRGALSAPHAPPLGGKTAEKSAGAHGL